MRLPDFQSTTGVNIAKLGDDGAFGTLVRLYERRTLALVRSLVGNQTEAEDLVQEAFVRAWGHLLTRQFSLL